MTVPYKKRLAALSAVVVMGGVFTAHTLYKTGKEPTGDRLAQIQKSPQWKGSEFVNIVSMNETTEQMERIKALFFDNAYIRTPIEPVNVQQRRGSEFAEFPASGLRITWLGHSTSMIEIDGVRILTDPVWGKRASPVPFIGPRRFYEPPLKLSELPDIDAVIISHDHYDHLDYETVKQLLNRDITWVVPLGLGAYLESWGVKPEGIVELDWWGETSINEVKFTATPARHYSGRLSRSNQTLWAGLAINGPEHAVFFSGDTGMQSDFGEIGEKLGPFDFTMMDTGSYSGLIPIWGRNRLLLRTNYYGASTFCRYTGLVLIWLPMAGQNRLSAPSLLPANMM